MRRLLAFDRADRRSGDRRDVSVPHAAALCRPKPGLIFMIGIMAFRSAAEQNSLRHVAVVMMCAAVLSSCNQRCSGRIVDVSQPIKMVILSVVTETGELLWELRGNGAEISALRYGDVPVGTEQVFPESRSRPRAIRANEKLTVTIYSSTHFYVVHGVGTDSGGFCGGTYETGLRENLTKHKKSLE
jgi:hypothetical protein